MCAWHWERDKSDILRLVMKQSLRLILAGTALVCLPHWRRHAFYRASCSA